MLVGYAIGKHDIDGARKMFTRALCLSVGVLITVFGGFLFPFEMSELLCSNAELRPLAFDYMHVVLIGSPAYILMWGLSTMVGVDGSPRLVSLAVIIDNIVNLFLDIVFIKWFDWGISGSSSATVVGHLVGIAILLCHWLRNRRLLPLFKFDGLLTSWRRIIGQGAPLALASVCLTLLLLSANAIVLSTAGRTGIFVFAVCMNLLQIYNLFLSGTCQTLQSLGAIQIGRGDPDGIRTVLRRSFRFITVSMVVTCIFVWLAPGLIARLFGASNASMISETNHALRIFSLSFIPFCYIYVLMIVYKLYGHHHMALFISLALSLTVIPVMWLVSRFMPEYLWYSYLVAYILEGVAIFIMHRMNHVEFNLPTAKL